MAQIQETLNSLQPHLIGIRYQEGVALLDVVLKTGWSIVETNGIKAVKGDESMNYYMIYSESPNIGIDDLLNYVRRIINLNLDREKKQELLNTKIVELKKLFKGNDLKQLGKLKFTFSDDEISHKLYEEDETFDETEAFEEKTTFDVSAGTYDETIINEELQEVYNTSTEPIVYLDENKQPIKLSDEELEILEEEARAERNRAMTSNKKKQVQPIKNISKVELPPKIENKKQYTSQGCHCGPEEACGNCIDSKGF